MNTALQEIGNRMEHWNEWNIQKQCALRGKRYGKEDVLIAL